MRKSESWRACKREIANRLRTKGHALLSSPGQAFERLHSRAARSADEAELERLARVIDEEELRKSKRDPRRVVDAAQQIRELLSTAPETLLESEGGQVPGAQWALVRACFAGVEAAKLLDDGTELREIGRVLRERAVAHKK